MRNVLLGEQLMYASYFAPRGRNRLYILGQQIGERYLSPLDRLIGIIGEASALVGPATDFLDGFAGLNYAADI